MDAHVGRIRIQQLLRHDPVPGLLEALGDVARVLERPAAEIVTTALAIFLENQRALNEATGFLLLALLVLAEQRLETISRGVDHALRGVGLRGWRTAAEPMFLKMCAIGW